MLLNRNQRFNNMASTRLSKVIISKSSSSIDFATEAHLSDFLEILRAKSNLPIKQMLAMLSAKEADTVSCSRDDTDYSFFASRSRKGIAITVKKLGEETIEFSIPKTKLKRIETI
jgi:hypothetical protein